MNGRELGGFPVPKNYWILTCLIFSLFSDSVCYVLNLATG